MSASVCAGKCKGTDRPVTDAPVDLVPIKSGGRTRKVVVCRCCGAALKGRRIKPEDLTGDIMRGLDPSISRAGLVEFDDPVCEYVYRLLPELRASA